MKKCLLEDIVVLSNFSLIKIIMVGEEDDLEMCGKIYGCDDYSFFVNWDFVMVMVECCERVFKNVFN